MSEKRSSRRATSQAGPALLPYRHASIVDRPGLKAFGRIEAPRTIDGKTTTDVRIFALSRQLSVEEFMTCARAHWQIENGLHWGLEVAMGEDAARNRRDHGLANLAVLRRRARDVAARETGKGSLSIKRKRAGWNADYLVELLHHMR